MEGLNFNQALGNFLKKLQNIFADKSHEHLASDISGLPTSLPANGGNAATVNGHSVNSDVPANAKFTDTNTTYSAMTGATASAAGSSGLVPAPAKGSQEKYLRGDGSWGTLPDITGKMNSANPTGTGAFSINRKADTTVGAYSIAMGSSTTASGYNSVAMGFNTTASGFYSTAMGYNTRALENSSTAMGYSVTASGESSTAMGHLTAASNFASLAIGKNNKAMTMGASFATSVGDVFVIGRGTSGAPSNCFRVTYAGEAYGLKEYTSSGADYAEFIKPWFDDNLSGEDRVGYFVTIKDGKLRFAEPDDYIIGITSGNPSVVGNGDEDWLGRWERDEFNRIIMEDVEEMEKIEDEETGEITYEPTGKIIPKAQFKANPEYDPSQKYIERKDRPEWDYVGMIGVLPLRDDGSCVAGGFAKCGTGGIATAADSYDCHKTFFVIERVNDHVISVEMR